MPLFKNIEQQLMSAKIAAGAPMTELQFFAAELRDWEHSPSRKEMLDGDRYYAGDHDILRRQRTAIDRNGKLTVVDNLPNNRIVDNLYAKHVDQKKNYLLGKPVTFESENADYAGKVSKILGRKFMRMLKNAGLDALNTGIAWLYPYYDEHGELVFKYFSGHEIMPFWKDKEHTAIDCACRLYTVETYEGAEKKLQKKVEIFKRDGVYSYLFNDGTLTPDPDAGDGHANYLTVTDRKGKTIGFNWERIPLIPMKQGAAEIPLIRRAKSLQDAINQLRSDYVNNMEEDIHTTILVLKNYDGQDPGEFRQNLATYGLVKVRSVDGVEGGVDALKIEVNSENYKTVLEMLKSALIENMKSFDGKDDRLQGSANQMNIQSLYTDIDLDANDMETELQAAFEDIFWFVNQHLANTGQGDYTGTEISVIFNRDILVVESEAIENCAKSAGIISDETIIAQHPWVSDPQKEIERMQAQREAEQERSNPYQQAFVSRNDPTQQVQDEEE